MKKLFTRLTFFFSVLILNLSAGPGDLDVSFDPGIGPNLAIKVSTVQADGKILLGGNFTYFNSTYINRLVRLNTDGSVDESFNIGSGANDEVYAIKVQSNGKILIGGAFTSFNGNVAKRIARLNSDGSFDDTFNTSNGFDNQVKSILIQNDGKIIAAGYFLFADNVWNNSIARLNTDGSVDTTFYSGDNGVNGEIDCAALQSDGKIIIGGLFSMYNGVSCGRFARLNNDGTLDNNFSSGTAFDNQIGSLLIQPDGKIVVAGYFTTYDAQAASQLARINSDGTLDNTFKAGNGTGQATFPNALALQSDGKNWLEELLQNTIQPTLIA